MLFDLMKKSEHESAVAQMKEDLLEAEKHSKSLQEEKQRLQRQAEVLQEEKNKLEQELKRERSVVRQGGVEALDRQGIEALWRGYISSDVRASELTDCFYADNFTQYGTKIDNDGSSIASMNGSKLMMRILLPKAIHYGQLSQAATLLGTQEYPELAEATGLAEYEPLFMFNFCSYTYDKETKILSVQLCPATPDITRQNRDVLVSVKAPKHSVEKAVQLRNTIGQISQWRNEDPDFGLYTIADDRCDRWYFLIDWEQVVKLHYSQPQNFITVLSGKSSTSLPSIEESVIQACLERWRRNFPGLVLLFEPPRISQRQLPSSQKIAD